MKPITNKEWKRIVEQTSRTDLPEPPFSRRYRERRLELERMVTMKEDRKFTFQPGLAVATVAALIEANEQDTPWRGKVVQETEIAGLTFETANLAQAQKSTQIYPSLQIQYQKSGMVRDTAIDLMYTSAPADEIHWGDDSDRYFDILDFDTFRVCVLAWNCTDDEINTVTEAIETAANSVLEISKEYRLNSHGETYGCAAVHMDRSTYDQLSDLIAFGGGSCKEGYVRKTELFEALGDDPDDAMNHLMQDFNKTDTAIEAPRSTFMTRRART